jgi:hypothetical protein
MGNGGAKREGGIDIHARGDVRVTAGGDIVGRDKVTTATTFAQGEKDQFLQQVEHLQAALREAKAAVEAAAHLDQDARDTLAAEIARQVVDLKAAKDAAAAIPAGSTPGGEPAGRVGASLLKTATLLEKLGAIADKAAEVGGTLGAALAKALPLLASARRLFGLG